MTMAHPTPPPPRPGGLALRLIGVVPPVLMQPALGRIVRRIAALHPSIFQRLGDCRSATFVIEPRDMGFALVLRPDPANPQLRAVKRDAIPDHRARISGDFLTLLALVDAGADGDALFFSRDLTVSGDTEAVVRLRNALDDVEGSIAGDAAALFGPPGQFLLSRLRDAAVNVTPKEGPHAI